jgi:hypothetical protein
MILLERNRRFDLGIIVPGKAKAEKARPGRKLSLNIAI